MIRTAITLLSLIAVLVGAAFLRYPRTDLNSLIGTERQFTTQAPAGTTTDLDDVEVQCEPACQLRRFFGLPQRLEEVALFDSPFGDTAQTGRWCVPRSAALELAERCFDLNAGELKPLGNGVPDAGCEALRARLAGEIHNDGEKKSRKQRREQFVAWLKKHGEERLRLEGACDAVRVAADHNYRVDAVIATVPDPMETALDFRFDQYVAAIRQAAEAGDYVLDRFYNPWIGRKPAENFYRKYPGALLFRRAGSGAQGGSLLLVLLVGETPTAGVHKGALRSALDLVAAIQRQADPAAPDGAPSTMRVGIIGPSFSGTSRSLEIGFREWLAGATAKPAKDVREGLARQTPLFRPDDMELPQAFPWDFKHYSFNFHSGAATDQANPEKLKDIAKGHERLEKAGQQIRKYDVRVSFQSTIHSDEELLSALKGQLEGLLGDNRDNKVALLVERNTTYGSAFNRKLSGSPSSEKPPWTLIAFPMGMHWVRSLYGEDVGKREADGAPRGPALRLNEARLPTDVMAPMSPLSTHMDDFALDKELDGLANRDVGFVGIVATDPRDVIFLAHRVKERIPGAQLFTTSANLLFVHEQVGDLEGMIVATTYPLMPWYRQSSYPTQTSDFKSSSNRLSQVFPDDLSQGVYNATTLLLSSTIPSLAGNLPPLEYGGFEGAHSDDAHTSPPVWLSVVGRGEFLPLKASPVEVEATPYVQAVDINKMLVPGAIHVESNETTYALFFVSLISLLLVGVHLLQRLRAPDESAEASASWSRIIWFAKSDVQARVASTVTIAVLSVLVGLLLWASRLSQSLNWSPVTRVFAAIDWAVAVAFLVVGAWAIFHTSRGHGPARKRQTLLASLLAAVVVTVGAVAWLTSTKSACAANASNLDACFEWLRMARLGGGMSWLVPTGSLLAALFVFATSAVMQRLRATRFDKVLNGWGIAVNSPPADSWLFTGETGKLVAATGSIFGAVDRFLLLWILFVPCSVAVIYGIRFIHPFESLVKWVLGGILLIVGAATFHSLVRFMRVVRGLDAVLRSLGALPFVEAFKRIPPELLYAFINPDGEQVGRIAANVKRLAGEAERNGNVAFSQGQRYVASPSLPARIAQAASRLRTVQGGGRTQNQSIIAFTTNAEDLLAMQWTAVLGYCYAQLLNLLTAITIGLMVMLFSVATYPLNQSSELVQVLWAGSLIASAAIAILFFGVARSEVSLKIARFDRDEKVFDFEFLLRLATYGGLPLLALLGLQFPVIRHFLGGWVRPLFALFTRG